jgi:hypothetical protein
MPVNMQPTSVIKANLGLGRDGRVLRYAVALIAETMDKYVPYREGNLAQYNIEDNKIIYDQEYAKYQYYGMSKNGKKLIYNTDKHPLATSYWDKEMWSAEKEKVIGQIQNHFWRK